MSNTYKQTKTQRGLTYNYLFAPAQSDKPTLLFLHGFPSTHQAWHHQIKYFGGKGYGLIVPDLLGYGGTDKPTDAKVFAGTAMAADLNDILDTEGIKNVVAIGHDWGCFPTSRLATLHPDRFLGFAWLAVYYVAPDPNFDYDKFLVFLKQATGSELFGYWSFFSAPDAPAVIERHMDSFLSMMYPEDHSLATIHIAPTGALRKWVESDQETEFGSYLPKEEFVDLKATLLKGGMASPLQWYTAMTSGVQKEDSIPIPKEKYNVTKPAFFGACAHDAICNPDVGKQQMAQYATNLTVHDFDSGHWVQLERPNETNEALERWVQTIS